MRKPRLGTILLTLWGLTLSAFVYAYLAWLQPSRLGDTVSYILDSSFGVHCDIGRVTLSLFPMPEVAIDDIRMHQGSVDSVEFHARRATVQVSWFSLLRLKPIVRTVTLETPTVDISGSIMQKISASPSDQAQKPTSFALPDIPRYVTGLRFRVHDGRCRFSSACGRDSLTVSGIDISARIPGLLPGSLELSAASARYLLASGIDITAQDTHISAGSLYQGLDDIWNGEALISTALQLGSLDKVMGGRISDPYRYFPMPEPLRFSLGGSFAADPQTGRLQAKGSTSLTALLPMNGHNVPISLNIPFSMPDISEGIDVTDADVRMEDDRLVISGRVSGIDKGYPVLRGKADIKHFSLTRWFGFGRLMDPGLQHALDGITGTFHDFELSAKGVVVPSLTAYVEGIELHGSGSCTEFLKPVVRIDAHAKKADLNRVFTELHGKFPDLSHLPPEVLPLVPSRPNQKPKTNAITVGYDIHISADDATIMNFRVGGADVHVIPAPDYGTMLTIDVADVYGGKADSKVYIQDKIRVVADLRTVALDGPSAALAGYPVLKGNLKTGKVDISFAPGTGVTMLTTLGGTVNAVMEKGSISVKGSSPVNYASFLVDAAAVASSGRGAKAMPPTVDFTGRWNVTFDSELWSVSTDASKATLAFSTRYGLPCLIRKQDIPLQLCLKQALISQLPQDLKLAIKGIGSFDAERGTLSLEQGLVEHPDFSLNGDASFSDLFKNVAVEGKASFRSSSLRKACSAFGIALPTETGDTAFSIADLNAGFAVADSKITLSGIRGHLDESALSGDLSCGWKNRPQLAGRLHTPFLDLDLYLPKTDRTEKSLESKTPLPLSFLRDTDVSLKLTADRLHLFSTSLTDVSVPVTQKNGTLSAPLKTSFPGGGSAAGHFIAALSADGSYANLALQARGSQINMLELSRSRGQKTLIAGMGSSEASLQSTQKYWSDWKRTLDGFFSVLVSNGAIISPSVRTESPDEAPAQSRTGFSALSMSGTVHDGIVSCKDFRIQDSMLNVAGEGTVDLAKETIDAHATITVAGIPEMPITLSGDLFAPKTNYRLLGAVAGTVGNLGSTLIDIVGTVITTPLRLFTGGRPLF